MIHFKNRGSIANRRMFLLSIETYPYLGKIPHSLLRLGLNSFYSLFTLPLKISRLSISLAAKNAKINIAMIDDSALNK